MAKSAGISFKGKKVLILGTGGASLTARLVAADEGASQVILVGRTSECNYNNISDHSDADIIVNCTPVGMFPNNGERLIDLDLFTRCEGVLDMIYNPARTAFLLDAQKRGIKYANGLTMLVAQAAKSAEYFRLNEKKDVDIGDIVRKISRAQKNIVLVGMPGCGKSTAAERLCKRLGRESIDTDAMIEERAGKSISEIFADDGEAYFRDLECACVKEAGKMSGKIIATGGGAIMRPENCDALRGNSFVIFLKREIADLDREGRPLSTGKTVLEAMYEKRLPMYRSTADAEVDVCPTKQETLEAIIKVLEQM